ncbi:MAG TPA: IPT/TIG domain-containing protein [Bryobacteraceae bacterium]|nr:IPT/TIG domain-containing protein [Bryobacteraceae bacterium]
MRAYAPVFLFFAATAAVAQTAQVPPPAVTNGGVTSTAGPSTGQAVAPGSLVSIFGTNLASTTAAAGTVPLSTTLSGVGVTVNNIAAPIQFISAGQINIQLPWEVTPSATSAQVVVTRDDGMISAPANVTVAASAPAIFSIGGQAIALNSDGSLAAPAGGIPGIATHPAKIGDPGGLAILATGLGAVDQPIVDGANSADMTRNALTPVTVMIGGVAAQVTFSGLSPQFVGINQINVIIPPGTPTGNAVTLQIQVNGTINSNPVSIAVSQ